jgi:hypothetical protein
VSPRRSRREGEHDVSAIGKVKVKEAALTDLVEKGGPIDNNLGLRLNWRQVDGIGLGVVFLDPSAVHGVVQSSEAEVKELGFGAADAVVFDKRQTSEELDLKILKFDFRVGGLDFRISAFVRSTMADRLIFDL